MGAKLSKKKKGYCLGAGKDGESTETTEVEQKETEAQAGQKDAAEPNGGSPPNDQTLTNGTSEEQKVHAEKNSTEVPSDETTKDDLKKDQKSENQPSAELNKVEESNQENLEHAKSSNVSEQMATEGGKEVKSQPEKKEQTDHDKEKELVGKDEPTQAPKPVTEQDRSEPKQPNQSVTEPSAPVPDQKEVTKSVPDPETKVEVEKMEKEQTPLLTTEHLSEEATKVPTPVKESVKEPEKVHEVGEPLVLETASVGPLGQELVSAQVVELVEPESASKAVGPETTEVSLPEVHPNTELIKPESNLASEPVTQAVPVAESVESKISEQFEAPVPDVKCVEPVINPELVPCPEKEKLSETKQETGSVSQPLPSNEVPDSTAQVDENVKSSKILGNDNLVNELLDTQAASIESAPAEQPSTEIIPEKDATVAENCPTEQAVEKLQENKTQDSISTEQGVEEMEMQKEAEEKENLSDKQPTEHVNLEKEKEQKATEEVALDTTKNENNQTGSVDPIVHDATQDKSLEDKAENHEILHEPSAPLIVDKHGVSNGLPLKEEVKEQLENGCDKDPHQLNGQGEGHEIEVCNE